METEQSEDRRLNGALPEFLRPQHSWNELLGQSGFGKVIFQMAEVYRVETWALAPVIFQRLGAAYGGWKPFRLAHKSVSTGFNVMVVGEVESDLTWVRTISGECDVHTADPKEMEKERLGKMGEEMRRASARSRPRIKESDGRGEHVEAEKARNEGARMGECSSGERILQPRVFSPVDVEKAILKSPDGHVLLGTPAFGVENEFNSLHQKGRLMLLRWLRESADGSQLSLSVGPKRGALHFHWRVTPSEVRALYQIAEMARIPGLLVESSGQAKTMVGASEGGFHKFQETIRMIQSERYRGRSIPVGGGREGEHLLQPVDQFHQRALLWERSPENALRLNLGWLAELALKLAHLDVKITPNTELVKSMDWGLAMAQHLGARHYLAMESIMESPVVSDGSATADLTDREKAVYLRICERGPVSRKDLGRSFHDLPADERDTVLAKLLERRLIQFEGDQVRQHAA